MRYVEAVTSFFRDIRAAHKGALSKMVWGFVSIGPALAGIVLPSSETEKKPEKHEPERPSKS